MKKEIILAPMAGITDRAFRDIAISFGVDYVFSEMVSAKAIVYKDKKTFSLLKNDHETEKFGIQIFGSEAKFLREATLILNEYNNSYLDINMGCPAPKIVKNGDGAALMKDPKNIEKILNEVVKVSKKPVSIKIRKGWDDNSINAIHISKIAEYCGVSKITIHGRTREEFYSGKADYNIIKKVKKSVNIPVIGNGDVFSFEDYKKIIKETNCDGVMIGRGAKGNPWIFLELLYGINNLKKEISIDSKIKIIKAHINMVVKYKGENIGIKEMRKHIPWYLKGYKNSSKLKNNINNILDLKTLFCELDNMNNYKR